jgi:hypothetical protein
MLEAHPAFEPLEQFVAGLSPLKREISFEHKAGFMWDTQRLMFVESDVRLKRRISAYALYRELVDGIRRNHGTTLYGMLCADVALRIERATESYELDAAGAALQTYRNGLCDEAFRPVLFLRIQTLAGE